MAKAKKEHMLKLEEEKKKKLPPSEMEQEKQAWQDAVASRAVAAGL